VLVVADAPDFVALLSDVLEKQGYDVVSATNGIQGLGALILERPEVIILDLDTPVTDGVGFAKKAETYGVSAPIILLTGYPEVPQWARLVGAAAYLTKPFEVTELLQIVGEVCGEA
jgi:CheY-like chemotaxis protein